MDVDEDVHVRCSSVQPVFVLLHLRSPSLANFVLSENWNWAQQLSDGFLFGDCLAAAAAAPTRPFQKSCNWKLKANEKSTWHQWNAGESPFEDELRTTHAGQITTKGFYFDGLSQGSATASI